MRTMREMIDGDAAQSLKGQKLPWEPFGGNTEPASFEIVFIYDELYHNVFDIQ